MTIQTMDADVTFLRQKHEKKINKHQAENVKFAKCNRLCSEHTKVKQQNQNKSALFLLLFLRLR